MYVHSISVELERPGSALSAVQNALVTFAEPKDLSSAKGCMGRNAISEFGQRASDLTRVSHHAAHELRQTLMHVLTRAKNQGEISSDANLDSMADFFESSLTGIRMAAKAGKSRQALRNIAAFAARAPCMDTNYCFPGQIIASRLVSRIICTTFDTGITS